LAIGKRQATTGFSRITTEGTGDTEGGKETGFWVCRAVSGSIEEAGSTGWIPRRASGNGNSEKSEPRTVSSPTPLCPLCPLW